MMDILDTLLNERKSLDPSFVHCHGLLEQEIARVQSGGSKQDSGFNGAMGSEMDHKSQEPISGSSPAASAERGMPRPKVFRKPGDYISEQIIKLSEKVFIPVKEFPRFNFVGKLLGPRGNTLKRLQSQTRTKMSVLGRGSMRNKEEEEQLRSSDDQKYKHLSEPLHVLIEVECGQSDAHMRLANAISDVKQYLTPENDEIRQDQMREMAFLQSIDDPNAPPPPGAGRARGRPMMRGGPMSSRFSPGRPGGLGRPGSAGLPPRHAAPGADPYGYEMYEPAYDTGYDPMYADAGEGLYYEYPPAEEYDYGAATSQAVYPTSYKSPTVRPVKRVIREATYPY